MADVKFCPKCGSKNPAGASFCLACGAKLDFEKEGKAAAGPNKNVKIIIIAAAALIALIAAAFLVMNMMPKSMEIDLLSNMPKTAVIFKGEDGSGTAEIDEVSLKNAADYDRENSKAKKFMDTVVYDLSKNSKLKNGSPITVKCSYSKATAAKYKIKVRNDTRKIVVTGLDEPKDEEETQNNKKGNVTINLYGSGADDVYDDYSQPIEYYDDITDSLDYDSAQKAINDIYARHGYIFSNNGEWQRYYDSKSWYTRVYDNMEDARAEMSDQEKRNIDALAKIRDGQ